MERTFNLCILFIFSLSLSFAQQNSSNMQIVLKNGTKIVLDVNTLDEIVFQNDDINITGNTIAEINDKLTTLSDQLNLVQTNVACGNVLYGKKWVACGDSFTEGTFGSLGGGKFEDGLYAGKNKVYPFYIGRRNNMVIVNEAICGSTMTKNPNLPDSDDTNRLYAFSVERYKHVPVDADYITLWFGINDATTRELGTINDNTNETFYGAWNLVLQYLIEHHPYAKIGIIVTNGTRVDVFKQAIRDVALKFGIPTLDMVKDSQVPPIFERDASLGYSSVIQGIRSNAFRVSETDGHPNPKAHEYESFFIENWLRSL